MPDVTVTPTLTISATAPSSPAAGDLWWNSAIGVFFVFYDDGSSTQWVTTQPVKYINIAELKAPAGGQLTGYYPDPVIVDAVVLEFPELRNPLGLLDYSQRLASTKWVQDKFASSGVLGLVTSGPGILLTPDPLAGDSTIALRAITPPLTVPGPYGSANQTAAFEINEFGQIISIANVAIPPIASPAFTGIPTAPTAGPATNTTQIATTAFVQTVVAGLSGIYAPIVSPAFTGIPTAPTAAPGTNTTQIATTAYIIAALGAYAPLASPTFTGDPRAPTPATADNDTSIATTAFVKAVLVDYLPLAGGTLTGALAGTSISLSGGMTVGAGQRYTFSGRGFIDPIGDGVFALSNAAGSAGVRLDVSTTAGTIQVLNNAGGANNAKIKVATQAPGTNTEDVATTAFVTAAIAAAGGGLPGSGTVAFGVRATANDTVSGPAVLDMFRTAATPVVDYNAGSAFSTAGATGIFTAPSNGKYEFFCTLLAGPHATINTNLIPCIRHTQAGGTIIREYAASFMNFASSTGAQGSPAMLSAQIVMAAGEKVQFLWGTSAAANITTTTVGGAPVLGSACVYAWGRQVTT
jgi:hypothetical protein